MPNQAEDPTLEPDKLQRLRERTDEIELVISGLTTLALFTLPGWLFESLSDRLTHFSEPLAYGASFVLVLITGLCYLLGAFFVLHLLTRAYWIGLIGLKTVFPRGIDWSRTPGIGPLTQAHYRVHLPDLKTAIRRADQLASSLFAVISLIALSMLWIGLLVVITLLISIWMGGLLGDVDRGLIIGFVVLFGVGAGLPALLWLLDAQVGARWPRLAERRWFTETVKILIRISGYLVPQRLILPVQLTLQSNTRPIFFIVLLGLGSAAIVVIGQTRWAGWQQFTVSGEFRYLGDDLIHSGMISSHYENLRTPKDRVRPWPMLTAFEQSAEHVPLFLPYWPARDNRRLDQLCPASPHPQDPVACMRLLWQISLNGEPISLEGFLPTERVDLGLRGLSGLVALDPLSPGLHVLSIEHDPMLDEEDEAAQGRVFTIPFAFSPQRERPMSDPVPRDISGSIAEE